MNIYEIINERKSVLKELIEERKVDKYPIYISVLEGYLYDLEYMIGEEYKKRPASGYRQGARSEQLLNWQHYSLTTR